MGWRNVDGWKNLPSGAWLVQIKGVERDLQVAYIKDTPNGKMGVIGGVFAFDERPVIAYHPLPVALPQEDSEPQTEPHLDR